MTTGTPDTPEAATDLAPPRCPGALNADNPPAMPDATPALDDTAASSLEDASVSTQAASDVAADPAIAVARWIGDLRLNIEKLRSAGLDDAAIAALAGLQLP